MEGGQVSLSCLVNFQSACSNFASGMEGVIQDLHSAITNLGETWKDKDFQTIAEKTTDLYHALDVSRALVAEELQPFVEMKLKLVSEK